MALRGARKTGFSLIEVMVAGVILTFSSVSIIGLINYANRLQERQGKRTSALKAHDTGIQLRTQMITNDMMWEDFVQFYYTLYGNGSNSVEFAVDAATNPAGQPTPTAFGNPPAPDPTLRFSTCSMQTLYDPKVASLSRAGAVFIAGANVNAKFKFYLYSIVITPRFLDFANNNQYQNCCNFLSATTANVNPYLPPPNPWPHYIFPELFSESGCATLPTNLPSYLTNYRILLTSIVFPIGTKTPPGGVRQYVVDTIREQTLITSED